MIQLRILSGQTAGETQIVRRFPFRIGRAPENDLRLEAAGVWDNHLTLDFQKSEGFVLHTAPETFAAINEEQKQSARLRNGDIIFLRFRQNPILARRPTPARPAPARTFRLAPDCRHHRRAIYFNLPARKIVALQVEG